MSNYQGIDIYHIPHTVVVPKEREQPLPPETTSFVPGKFGGTYLEDSFSSERLPTLVPAGRPYFDHTIPNTLDSNRGEHNGRLRLMIGTQDKPDLIRQQFLTTILDAIEMILFDDIDIVLKIHPSEKVTYYERLLDEYDGSTEHISIASDSLWDHVDWADIVLTINSNVGLEAMYAGTPCICVNHWKPFTPDFPWATSDSVPVLETRVELRDYLNSLDRKTIDELASTQSEFVDDAYRNPWDSADAIARYIEERNCPVA